ncbi:hypothetical protein [Thermococcus sp.]
MRRKATITILSISFLLSIFAYNAYTYHQLSSAEGAYKLAGISNSEKLIAVYHDKNFWQFATYNEKTNTLKLYTISQSSPFWPKKRKVESAKALVNYSPLSLDLKVLRDYKPHEKALLFKTLGWKYNEELVEVPYPKIFDVVSPDVNYFEIIGTLSGKGIRIGARNDGSEMISWIEGVRGLLLLPGRIDSTNISHGFIWVVLEKNESSQIVRTYYPGVILERSIRTVKEKQSFRGVLLQKALNNASVKLEIHKTPEFGILRFHAAKNEVILDIIWKVSPDQICHAQKNLLKNTTNGPVCYYKTR